MALWKAITSTVTHAIRYGLGIRDHATSIYTFEFAVIWGLTLHILNTASIRRFWSGFDLARLPG